MPRITPRVTVVLPVYNQAPYVEQAVRSLLEQTFSDLHVVVADDGSTDSSIQEIAKFGSRVTYLEGSHRGPAGARNRALARCDSEFVAFMDADDVCSAQRISSQVEFIERTGVDMVASELRFIDENGSPLPGRWSRPDHAWRDPWGALLDRNWIGTPSVLVKRRVLNEVGFFDEKFTHAEDYDLWLRIGRYHSIGYIDEPLVSCRRHENNISMDLEAHRLFECRALQKVAPEEARTAFEHLYSETSAAAAARLEESWIWFLLRSGSPAIESEMECALRRHPESAALRFAQGIYLNDAGRFGEALKIFNELAESDPAALNNSVVLSRACGKATDAHRQFRKALAARPDYHDSQHNLTAWDSGGPLRLTRRSLREALVPMRFMLDYNSVPRR